jgi:hypothetical protein
LVDSSAHFKKLSALERFFNGAIGALVRVGIGSSHMRVLEVRGRRSGRVYTLPVDLLEIGSAQYLVAPRGRTEWVRNAEAQGEVVLRRGRRIARFRLQALPAAEKPAILKAYLDSFRSEVQRFFPVQAGAPVAEFVPLVERYPAFRLEPVSS